MVMPSSKNPGTHRIKISRLWVRKSWQVYLMGDSRLQESLNELFYSELIQVEFYWDGL